MTLKVLIVSQENWLYNALITYQALTERVEFFCATSYQQGYDYYIYDKGISAAAVENALIVADLFAGKVRLQELVEEIEKRLVTSVFNLGDLKLDFPARILSLSGREVKLTEMQTRLARLLMLATAGVNKQEIAELALEYKNGVVDDSNVVENHVSKLRKAIKVLDDDLTIINEGSCYRLQLPEA